MNSQIITYPVFLRILGFAGLLLVNLGFWNFRFSYFRFSRFFCFWKIFLENMLVRYRGINNKGVLERPWTKLRVLRAISSTLKFQFTVKCWKVDFLMSSKTRSCESSREKFRMVRALLPDTPRPPQFQPELQFFSTCYRIFGFPVFPRFTNKCLDKTTTTRQSRNY